VARGEGPGGGGGAGTLLRFPPDALGPARGRAWAILASGFVLRVLLCAASWGTTDALSFLHFAHRIDDLGFFAAYRADPLLNHPPLPAWWSLLALKLAGGQAFAMVVIFRLPVIAADFASAMLLRRILVRRGASPRAGLAVAAMYAWNPCAILISGYHGNTDAVYAMLGLLALHLLEDVRRPLLGGLVLGLAINIKLIPVLLIAPLCFAARSRRELLLFLTGWR
jgi:Gpi18-like mannosyltransferase